MVAKQKKSLNLDRKYVNILGVNVTSTSRSSVLARIRNLISHNSKFYIVTPNPELVVMSKEDSDLRSALNSANFAIPDGVGLNFASWFLTGRYLKVVPGRKLFLDLIELANKKVWRVFLLGGEKDEAELAARKLELSFKKIKIESFPGPAVDNNARPISEDNKKLYFEAIERINKYKPQLLFVAMQNPKQEKWIYRNIKTLDIGGAMAVGGTFRYIAGYSKLPPPLLASLGLEWFWRLVTEPWRIKRVLTATLIFPLKVLWYKVFNYEK